MRVKALVQVLAKTTRTWKDKEGIEHPIYSANIVQNNGEIIDTIRLTQEHYNLIEGNKTYSITADYENGSNGNYLRIIDIMETK